MTAAPTRPAADPYAGLDPGDELWLRGQTEVVHGLFRRTAEAVIGIGRVVGEVRGRIGDGRFMAWVAAELPFSYQTANRMELAARSGLAESSQIGNLRPSALYLLVQHNTPPAARDKALELAAAGHVVTHAAARRLVALARRAGGLDPDSDAGGPAALSSAALSSAAPGGKPADDLGRLWAAGRLVLDTAPDPDGDPVYTAAYAPADPARPQLAASGRDPAGVLADLAGRAARPPLTPARQALAERHYEWAEKMARSFARPYGLGPEAVDHLRGAARAAVAEAAGRFDPARADPNATEEDAFRGWCKPTLRGVLNRERIRLGNGGLYASRRENEHAGPIVVGALPPDDRE